MNIEEELKSGLIDDVEADKRQNILRLDLDNIGRLLKFITVLKLIFFIEIVVLLSMLIYEFNSLYILYTGVTMWIVTFLAMLININRLEKYKVSFES